MADGPRAPADVAYAVLSAGLAVALLIHQLNEQWSRDVFVHIASIREFSAQGLAAANPFIASDAPDAYLTPFHLLAGALDAAGGWDITTTLTVIGLVNLAILVTGLRAFVRLVTPRPWAPAFAMLFTLVAWGLGPWRYSGYLSLNSIGYGLPYPSVFSIGVGLLAIVAMMRYLRGESARYLAAAVIGGAAALLCHPLSALWLGAIAAAFVTASVPTVPRKRVLVVGGAGVALVALSLAWPFYSLVDVVRESHEWEAGNQSLYRLLPLRAFLAAPGAVALWLRMRKHRADPLVIAALLIGALYVAGFVLDRGTLGRTFPGLMLVLHVAFADVAADVFDRGARPSERVPRAWLATTVAVVVVGLAGVTPGLLRAIPRAVLPSGLADDQRLASVVAPWEPLDTVLDRDAVVATPDRLSEPVAAFGGHLLVPPVNAPSLRPDDIPSRREARDVILADPSSFEALTARRRYGVTHVVVSLPRSGDRPVGRVLLTTANYEVIALG